MIARAFGWLVLAVAFAIPSVVSPSLRALDFGALYCAGDAVNAQADPYRAQPLAACERQIGRGALIASGTVIPAPLPPYTLALVAPLARLPFALAQRLFDLVSLGALALAIVLLRRITRLPALAVAYALAPLAWLGLALGQTTLLLLGAIAATAALLRGGRDAWAGTVAALTMLEPHVGLPLCVALFVCRARTRLPLVAIGAAYALLGAFVLGAATGAEYVTAVLPAHAHAEAGTAAQCSLASLLIFLGAAERTALALGTLAFVAAIALGTAVAARCARRWHDAAAFAVVPVAFGLAGATFVHDYDYLLAVPAALLLLRRRPVTLPVVLALLALLPWWRAAGGVPAPALAVLAAVVLFALVERAPLRGAVLAATLAVVAVFGLARTPVPVAPVADVPATALAQASWLQHERTLPMRGADVAANIPAWLGLLTLCALAAV